MKIEEANKIFSDFLKYIETGNEMLIIPYAKIQLRMALGHASHHDHNKIWYKEIEKRISQLEQDEKDIRNKKERFKEKMVDRLIGFVIGVVTSITAGLSIYYLRAFLNLH